MTTQERRNTLENTFSDIAGVKVGITCRSTNEFTFDYDGISKTPAKNLKNYFKDFAKEVTVEFDKEIKATFIYVTL